MDTGSMNEMMAAMFFGAFGVGYFIYGKKQANFAVIITGVALMVYPYFVPGVGAIIVIGMALMALPFLLARFS
ncbi:MAG: hypothetical protein OEV92_02925 [Nitrospinota bacterium]|nr:hypothetical protein [Nitrospinota bacterium]